MTFHDVLFALRGGATRLYSGLTGHVAVNMYMQACGGGLEAETLIRLRGSVDCKVA